MVKINRPAEIPVKLVGDGSLETANNIALYRADVASFQQGTKKFSFDSNIYGHDSVKVSLKTAQHDKCCFCESQVTHIAYGDVEHFRPKAAYVQNANDALQRPGYFWLAYEWSNLLFCCQICNQRFKKNLFPLLDPTTRVSSPDGNVKDEDALFVDPTAEEENPEDFIGFRGDTPFARDGNRRGEATIEALGLKRETLRGRRAALLEKLKLIYDIANYPNSPFGVRANQLLQNAVNPREEYSAAVKCALQNGFKYV